jgi:hypothetical protein
VALCFRCIIACGLGYALGVIAVIVRILGSARAESLDLDSRIVAMAAAGS